MRQLVSAVRGQKRSVVLALSMSAAAFWVAVPMGEWPIGVFVTVGVLLSFANNMLTERTLLRSVENGETPSRREFGSAALVRMAAITLVALGLAYAFWPEGLTVVIGLAAFHLVAFVFTAIPLLREMKKA